MELHVTEENEIFLVFKGTLAISMNETSTGDQVLQITQSDSVILLSTERYNLEGEVILLRTFRS